MAWRRKAQAHVRVKHQLRLPRWVCDAGKQTHYSCGHSHRLLQPGMGDHELVQPVVIALTLVRPWRSRDQSVVHSHAQEGHRRCCPRLELVRDQPPPGRLHGTEGWKRPRELHAQHMHRGELAREPKGYHVSLSLHVSVRVLCRMAARTIRTMNTPPVPSAALFSRVRVQGSAGTWATLPANSWSVSPTDPTSLWSIAVGLPLPPPLLWLRSLC